MALCLQHEGYQDTQWAEMLCGRREVQHQIHKIDILIAAAEHVAATLNQPIATPGDDLPANEAMLADPSLVECTGQLLEEFLLVLHYVRRNPSVSGEFLKFAVRREPWTLNEARAASSE